MFNEKTNKFPSDERRKGNIGGAYIDGDVNRWYIAHSAVNTVLDAGFRNYKGTSQIVWLKDNRRFKYVDVPKADGKIRGETYCDSEAKLFEFLADEYERAPFKEITMLSQRGMCDSCKGIMEQFKAAFPDVKINIVSNKQMYNVNWR